MLLQIKESYEGVSSTAQSHKDINDTIKKAVGGPNMNIMSINNSNRTQKQDKSGCVSETEKPVRTPVD